MGGYFSDTSNEKEENIPSFPSRERVSCDESFEYVENPVLFTSRRADSLQNLRMFTTPKDERSSDLENYGVLPDLVVFHISQFLPLSDLPNVYTTCKLFYHITNSSLFWKRYYQSTFFGSVNQSEHPDEPNTIIREINWKKHFFFRKNPFSDSYYSKKYNNDLQEPEKSGYAHAHTTALKCVVIGKSGVGKSSFYDRAIRSTFYLHGDNTIGASFLTRIYYDAKKNRKLDVGFWDTAGQERYRSIAPMYFRGADICFLCFSIDCKESFDQCCVDTKSTVHKSWYRYLQESRMPERLQDSKEELPVVILLGLKSDLEDRREVSQDNVMNFLDRNKGLVHGYIENSAKTGRNVMVSVGVALDLVVKKLEYMEGVDTCYEEDLSNENRADR